MNFYNKYNIILCFAVALLLAGCRDQRSLVDEGIRPHYANLEVGFNAKGIYGVDSWEDSLLRATILVYRHQEVSDNAVPVIKYLFSALDLKDNRALIPMETDFLVDQDVDIYTIVNSRDSNVFSSDKPLTRGELTHLVDSNAAARYNNSSLTDLSRSIISSGGFLMVGSTTVKIEKAGITAQQIPVVVKRTVSRIDVDVVTDMTAFRRYATEHSEPNATIQISAAWLLRGNRRVPAFDREQRVVDDFLPPYAKNDTIVQGNDKYLPELYLGAFRFYIFPTDVRGAITEPFWFDGGNDALKLWVRAIYDPDGNSATENSRTVFYSVPIYAGGNSTTAGAIARNTHYKISLIVMGLNQTTEEEVEMPIAEVGDAGVTALKFMVGGAKR